MQTLLTIAAVGAAAIWIVGALVILRAVSIVPDDRTDAGGNFPLALTMAFFWPLWVLLGIGSALIEEFRHRSRQKPPVEINQAKDN